MAVNTKKTGSTSSAVTKMALRPKRMVSILKELASSRKKKASAISRPNKTASCAKEIASNFEHASNPKKTAKKVSFAADGNKPSEAPQISELPKNPDEALAVVMRVSDRANEHLRSAASTASFLKAANCQLHALKAIQRFAKELRAGTRPDSMILQGRFKGRMFSHLLLANAFYVECNLVHAFWELRLRRLVVKAADAAVGLAELAPGRFHVMEELLQSVQSKALMATAQMALGRSSRS